MAKNSITIITERDTFFDGKCVFCYSEDIMAKRAYYKVRSKLTRDQVLTIPNILTFFRLALIPLIIWLYAFVGSREWAVLVILISGLTDILDGFIARKFNMMSDLGKAIDPLADKLTQLAVLSCLIIDYPLIALPVGIMVVKELSSFVLRFILFKQTEQVRGARWHGKINTTLLVLMMVLHILWLEIPPVVSNIAIIACTCTMIFSCVLYTIEVTCALIEAKKANDNAKT